MITLVVPWSEIDFGAKGQRWRLHIDTVYVVILLSVHFYWHSLGGWTISCWPRFLILTRVWLCLLTYFVNIDMDGHACLTASIVLFIDLVFGEWVEQCNLYFGCPYTELVISHDVMCRNLKKGQCHDVQSLQKWRDWTSWTSAPYLVLSVICSLVGLQSSLFFSVLCPSFSASSSASWCLLWCRLIYLTSVSCLLWLYVNFLRGMPQKSSDSFPMPSGTQLSLSFWSPRKSEDSSISFRLKRMNTLL